MTKKAAHESVLGELHSKVARVMIKALDHVDEQMDKSAESDLEDAILIEPNPALLGAVTKFLKDNDISCDVGDTQELNATQRRLAEKRAKREGALALRDLPLHE